MGNIDIFIRILVTNVISGTLDIVLLVLASVFVLTSLMSFCPLYTLVGINTCPKDK